jgi:polysaccharide deacetylase family protein (PEP-CTERM system associated)
MRLAADTVDCGAMKHAFTVDVEDWFHGMPLPHSVKETAEARLERGLLPLLDLMEEAGAKGTFYVLGPCAVRYPELIREIARRGHEIGSHGWSHDLVYEMTRERFRDETRRSMDVVSELVNRPILTYRAAYFSITKRSWWAIEELANLGITTDSSVFPVHNWRYGIPGFAQTPTPIDTPHGRVLEVPLGVRGVAGREIPITGGAYLRIYPYFLTRANMRWVEREGRRNVFYIHPWELDAEAPRVRCHWKAYLTHYANLRSTEGKLKRLLSEFEFGTVAEVFGNGRADADS